jgi:hypothetical protein
LSATSMPLPVALSGAKPLQFDKEIKNVE